MLNVKTFYRDHHKKAKYFLVLLIFILSDTIQGQKFKEMIKDSTDNAIDISGVLNSDLSFLPIPIIITEPAVGFGGGLALGYFHKDRRDPNAVKGLSPTVSFLAAAYTSNNTWFVLGGHQGSYLNDRIRYLGVLGYMSVNLTFYGADGYMPPGNYRFNMKGFLTLQELLYRVSKKQPFFAGLNYTYLNNTVSFMTDIDIPGLDKLEAEINTAGLNSVFLWDGRNNSLTPTKGIMSTLELGRYATFLGGDNNYWNFESRTYGYVPIIKEKLFSGYRLSLATKDGDVPFYELPFISLRGIPALRYQDNNVITVETEWRWQFIRRWSLLGFIGAGEAADSYKNIGKDIKVAGGGGFRYLLARDYGLHAGVDIARGPEQWAWNITIGSHWRR